MSNLDLFAGYETHDPGCKRPIRLAYGVQSAAEFGGYGDCYRYKLQHTWADGGSCVLFLMMNPSFANDSGYTDATVAKCGRIARRWGYGGLYIGNACSYRATNRMRLLQITDPVGPRNHEAILEMAAESSMIVIGHGNLPGKLQVHADAMVKLLRGVGYPLYVLGLSDSGVPLHPLARGKRHVPEDVTPVLWKG